MNKLQQHYFSGESDFLAMRKMLIDGYALERRPCNMFFYYLDNWRYARDDGEEYFANNAILWKDGGKTVAFCILNNESLYSLQVHPFYFDAVPQILDFLLLDKKISRIAAYEHQAALTKHFSSFGLKEAAHIQNEYEYDISENSVQKQLPEQYIISTIYKAKGLVFPGPGTSVEACAFRMRSKQQAPSYSNEGVFLVYDKGMTECVSFAMAWYEPETSVVGFEPVGTVANHRRRGLGKALLSYAFSKARADGYKRVSIKTGSNKDAAANYLYLSLDPINVYKIIEFSIPSRE